MTTTRKVLLSALTLSVLPLLPWETAAHAQTAMSPRSSASSSPGAGRPVPPATVDQAKAQLKGDYGPLLRTQVGGQVQQVWDTSDEQDGVFVYQLCFDCVYKARVRERMVTVVELPKDETINAVELGDAEAFSVAVRGERRLSVRALGQGLDTNMMVFGKSGRLYPIYLRAEGFNSENVPDLLLRIRGLSDQHTVVTPVAPVALEKAATGKLPAPDVAELSQMMSSAKTSPAGDFIEVASFDPDKLHGWGDYKLWGSDERLKPETVFRDDRFTYIKYGELWAGLELPTAYVVVDSVDEQVNTRVVGSTFIVESIAPLITLKSGESYLCIEYAGNQP